MKTQLLSILLRILIGLTFLTHAAFAAQTPAANTDLSAERAKLASQEQELVDLEDRLQDLKESQENIAIVGISVSLASFAMGTVALTKEAGGALVSNLYARATGGQYVPLKLVWSGRWVSASGANMVGTLVFLKLRQNQIDDLVLELEKLRKVTAELKAGLDAGIK